MVWCWISIQCHTRKENKNMNDEDLIQENDHFEIPEEYLHMNLDELRKMRLELERKILESRGQKRE